MAELTQHDAEDGFHEIQLSGKQLVFLFMATTIVAVAIFLCGVQVGRGVRTERPVAGDAGEPIAAAPAAASTPSQPVASSGPPAAEPPAPPKDDDLTYAKRLQSDSTPTEKLKPADPPPAAPAPARAATPTPQKAAPAAASGRPGNWIVQVISLQDRAAAGNFAKRLADKGYPAFVLDPAAGAPRIYRVQVGGYADKGDAEQASRRLEREEQLKPLVRAR